MAKKKTSRKSVKGFIKFLPLCLMLLAAAVIGMGFLPAVSYTAGNSTTTYSMYQLGFGATLASASGFGLSGKLAIGFNIWIVLALFLPVVGAVISLFVKGKLGGAISTVLFLYSSVMVWFVLLLNGVTASNSITKDIFTSFSDAGYGLGVGTILSGVFAILGTLVSAFYTIEA